MKKFIFFLTLCSFMSLTTVNAQFWDINGNSDVSFGNFVGTLKTVPLNLATNNIINVTLTPKNGFVGIGTEKPNWNLHLHTNLKFDGDAKVNAFQMTNFATGTDRSQDGFIIYQLNTQLLMQQREDDLFKIRTMGGGMTVDPEGDVGFGTDIPHQEIHVVDGNILITKYSGHTKDDIRRPKDDGSPNGSIMFGEYAIDDCPHGVWGIEYLSGSDDAYGLNFWKPWTSCFGNGMNYALFLADDGNVGIGTGQPVEKLSVNGDFSARNAISMFNGSQSIFMGNAGGNALAYGTAYIGFNAKKTGTAWTLQSDGAHNGGSAMWSNIRGDIFFSCIGSGAAGSTAQTVNDNTVKNSIVMQITHEGFVKAREVLVTLSNWPDYVFAPDYELPSISETEAYIKTNGHLPEVPSAAEVEADGVKVGEMDALLLKKIEELTLYVIELQKQINELKASSQKGDE